MELQSDVGHLESHFFSLWRLLVSAQDRCTICAKRTIGLEIVLTQSMVLLGNEAQVKAHFGPLEIVLILT
jgi:hypothetical protein